jgi:hypothetical protein
MYIEDLLSELMYSVKTNRYDLTLVQSFYEQINYKNLGFTEKQSVIMLKMLKAYKHQINAHLGKDITPLLDAPLFKYKIRTISMVKHISTHISEKTIKVKFPYEEKLVNEIKKVKTEFSMAEWQADEKLWIFSLEDKVINFFSSWIERYSFTADTEFKNFTSQIEAITSNIEQHIPMLTYDGKNTKYSNVHSSVPELTSDNILTSIFEARRAGITTWDSNVDNALDTCNKNEIVKNFIKSDPSDNFSINLEENSILELKTIVQNLLPCIVTVPGGNELAKMQQALELLKEIGIENQEISVLFRLPSENGGDFNKFVKEEKLNSPVSETTKVVILSGKLPKTVFQSELKFNCVLNFNFYNVHYTLANFMKNRHNVINVLADKKTKVY